MVPGPLFRVELVAAARQRRYYLLRVLYACIILFTLWVSYESMSYRTYAYGGQTSIAQAAETAKAFFYSFSWVQLIGILAVGPAMAVGTIATERERRTIEYLFATDLSNLEIVLGKTFARLLVVGKFVLVSLPILFLFRLLGGIPAEMVAASFLIAGSTALFVTALSVCVSVWSARARDAAMRVYRIVFAILILPLILTWMDFVLGIGPGAWRDFLQPVIDFLRDLNPLWVFGTASSSGFSSGAGFQYEPVLRMVGYHTGLSIALVALATAAVRRVHLREAGAGARPKKSHRNPRTAWLPRWRPEIGDNGMLWKEAFAPTSKARLGMVAGAANILIVLAVLSGILYSFFESVFNPSPYNGARQYFQISGMFSGFIGGGVLLLLAARASGLVTIEKERDCWISLLSTPLTGGEIIRGKMLGNLYSARWGALLLLISAGLCVLIAPTSAIAVAGQMLAFGVCAWFVTNLGLYFSLRSTTSLRAMGFTLGVGCFVGGGYLMCCCPLMAIGGGGGSGDEMMVGLAPCMPFLIVTPIALFDLMSHEYGGRSIVGTMTMAYILGLIGYAGASAALMNYLAAQFDREAGRTTGVPDRIQAT